MTNSPPSDTLVDPGQLLSADELAARWSVTRAHIYNLMARDLPSVKVGRCRRIRVGDAEAWLAAQQEATG